MGLRESALERASFVPEVKARVIEMHESIQKNEGSALPSNQISRDEYTTAFTNLGALEPPYDPEMLALLFEHSNSLRQNIDAYATNIDAFGHRFDPVIDVDAENIDERIANAIRYDRQRQAALMGDDPADDEEEPEPEEIQTAKDRILRAMRYERIRLQHFFEYCCPEMSFVTLRRQTRQDLESMGNAYWEVLRNRNGDITQFQYVTAFTIRLLPLDREPVVVSQKIRVSDLTVEEVPTLMRKRRYVQIVEGRAVFFKELGDPRLISSESGMVYPDLDAMLTQEPRAKPATELLHFRIHSARSAYGVPRWMGNLLAVLGSRQAEEVNFNYFENKSVPPLAILVSGGRMNEDSVDRIKDYVETNVKGKRNFHRILVLEADSGDQNAANAARMKIAIQPLTQAQNNDALFQNYDERNIDKVGQSFRLPRMLRGDIRDFNRSTADAALTFAEVQVFEPERQEFDFFINRKILSVMGFRYWQFVSLAPVIRDAVAMSEIIRNLSNASVLTPEEGRELAGDVFNREFKRLKAAWVKQPSALTVAGVPLPTEDGTTPPLEESSNFGPEGGEIAPVRPPGEGIAARHPMAKRFHKAILKEAARLIGLRNALDAAGQREWNETQKTLAEQGL